MATGFAQPIITFVPSTSARAEDVNANFANLNGAGAYTFTTCQVDPALTPDATFRGLTMITATDFGLLNNTSNNWLRLATGNTVNSAVIICNLANTPSHRFWVDANYAYIDAWGSGMRFRSSQSVNAARLSATNIYTISSTNYGFITAASAVFGQGSANADIAEPLLTQGNPQAGMAVCVSGNETVAPCTHVACKIAKIVSTAPGILMAARVANDEDMTPLEGHESAMPIVIGGVAPVKLIAPDGVRLGDRITTSGMAGLLRVALDGEYALGDIIKIADGMVYAWIHY